MSDQRKFLSVGLLAGLLTLGGAAYKPETLRIAVGPFFFCALIVAIALTNAWGQLSLGLWRYPLALCIATVGYIVSLTAFAGASGYAPDLLGVHASHDITE